MTGAPATSGPSLRVGFASNLAGVAWTAAMILAFTPTFVRLTGVEGYGLIGFHLTLQAVLQVLDFGFAPTVNRWLSRFSAGQVDPQEARDFARTLEAGSWTVAILSSTILLAATGLIARFWLRETQIPESSLRASLMLMVVAIMTQLPITYYQSALLGLQRPVSMNVFRGLAATAANGGAALVMILAAPTVRTYFAVQAVVGLLHAALLAVALSRALSGGLRLRGRIRLAALRTSWRFTAGLSAITICAVLLTQADRLILSRVAPLESFGVYSIAWMLASGLAVVGIPALNTVLPRFSRLVAAGDTAALRGSFHDACLTLSTLLLPLGAVVTIFALPILQVWIGDASVARSAAPMAALLSIGMVLNILMIPFYALQLAAGATRLALLLTVMQLAVMIPLVWVLAVRSGAAGAAWAWPVVCLLYCAIGSVSTFARLLPDSLTRWLARDVGPPLVITVAVAAIARAVLPVPESRPGAALLIIGVLVTTMGASAAVSWRRLRLL